MKVTQKLLLAVGLTFAQVIIPFSNMGGGWGAASVAAQTTTPLPNKGSDGGEAVITTENGSTVINTTTLAEDVEGYAGPVPLKIFIKKDKIEKIEALKNLETPKYFALIKRDLLNKWNGLTVKKAATQEVDVITGATYTSEAVIENVRRGLDFYTKKGKK